MSGLASLEAISLLDIGRYRNVNFFWNFGACFLFLLHRKSFCLKWAEVASLDCLTLKMKAKWSFETSVTICQTTRRTIPVELNLHQHCCEKLKYPTYFTSTRIGKFRQVMHGIRVSEIVIFCWPCISIYLFININQLDALNFIICLFQASTCFEHMCSSSGGQNCIRQCLVSSHL